MLKWTRKTMRGTSNSDIQAQKGSGDEKLPLKMSEIHP